MTRHGEARICELEDPAKQPPKAENKEQGEGKARRLPTDCGTMTKMSTCREHYKEKEKGTAVCGVVIIETSEANC